MSACAFGSTGKEQTVILRLNWIIFPLAFPAVSCDPVRSFSVSSAAPLGVFALGGGLFPDNQLPAFRCALGALKLPL